MQIPDLIVDTGPPSAANAAGGASERSPGKPVGDHETEEFASALEALLLATAGAQLVLPSVVPPGQAVTDSTPGHNGEAPQVDAAITLMAALRGVIETATGIKDTEAGPTPASTDDAATATEIAPAPEAPLPADLPVPAEPPATAEVGDALVTELDQPTAPSDPSVVDGQPDLETGEGQAASSATPATPAMAHPGEGRAKPATPATPAESSRGAERRIDGLERAAQAHAHTADAAAGTTDDTPAADTPAGDTTDATSSVVDNQPASGPSGAHGTASHAPASAPGAPRAEAPSAPVRVEGLAPAFLDAIENAQAHPSGTHRLTVRLDPPELGSVSVHLVAHGDDVRIVLRADTPEARAALETQRSAVEQALASQGFDLSSFDVHGDSQRQWGQSRRTREDAGSSEVPDAADDGAVDADDLGLRL